jgi:tight adherence protein B
VTGAASVFGSDVALLLVLGACFVAVFLVTTFLMGSRARARRDKSLAALFGRRERRVEKEASQGTTQWLPEFFAQAGERFATATGFSAALDRRLEQAGMPILAGEFVALTAGSALVGAIVAAIFLPNVVFIVLIAGVAALLPYGYVMRSDKKRRNLLVDQLADTMSILATSLRAGYSFLQALDTVSKEIGEPSAGEFQRVVAEIRLGRPVEEALAAMAERIGSDDLKWAVIAINIQRQVGGNLAEVLDILATTVRERAYVRRQVKVLSAEGRLSVVILSLIPLLLLAYLAIVNPDYLAPLFNTAAGLAMLVAGGVFMTVGIWIMSRIIKIKIDV